jgi:peroxiredoxin
LNNTYEIISDEYSFLKKGDQLPAFKWQDETGTSFSSETLLGKDTIIIFFAANCRHCRDNFAYLEKESFSKNFPQINIMAIGRDCGAEQLVSYLKKYTLSFNLTADPDREIYSKFAEKVVPRIYHFNQAGLLLQSIRGFRPEVLDELIKNLWV